MIAAAPNLTWRAAATEVKAVGGSIAFLPSSIYALEMVHPSFRGPQFVAVTSAYLWGQIPGALLTWATADMAGPRGFRIPMIAATPAYFILLFTIPMIPESPRWLVANGRYEEAHSILVHALV